MRGPPAGKYVIGRFVMLDLAKAPYNFRIGLFDGILLAESIAELGIGLPNTEAVPTISGGLDMVGDALGLLRRCSPWLYGKDYKLENLVAVPR